LAFLAYALFGNYLPAPWTHKGYDVARLVGYMYMTLEGIFSTAIDVSSSLIILFTILVRFYSLLAQENSSLIFHLRLWVVRVQVLDAPL
jgi:TRAP-type uncharacterized transport system fused permease subunit